MLTRALARAGIVLLLSAATTGLMVTTAEADGPVSCSPGTVWSRLEGTCVISVTAPADPLKTPRQANKPQPAGGKQKCVSKATGKELPCKTSDGYWVTSWGCYASLLRPQPPKSDAIWEGHDDGAIYECYDPDIVGTAISWRWAAASPAGPAAPPDPRLLAREAVASMRLKAITIGIVPEPRPDRIGVIGLPTWMWAEKPGDHTWGPITRTASARGYTVRATAKVDRVVWAMGDGSTIVCRKPGTPYADEYGKRSSPDCGHTYTRQGTYTVRATSYWTVTWSGIGLAGTIPMQFTRATVIRMGEVQVLTTR